MHNALQKVLYGGNMPDICCSYQEILVWHISRIFYLKQKKFIYMIFIVIMTFARENYRNRSTDL